MLGHHKRVLVIGAHPDDEDTELLTVLVRGQGAEAAYLSLNRGEGGQNLIGPELGDGLGLIRSEELLAARSLDGARQYFTRAFDYGFSKTIDEAWKFWPRDSVLKDVVRIVRRFRPQLVVSIFSGTPRDGHGQHQAAGWAAQEAFRIAGDSTRFPELAREEGLRPWAPSKLFRNAWFDTTGTTAHLNGGMLDSEIGQSYHQIAMRGRSLHRSQEMGMLQEIGGSTVRLALLVDRTGTGGTELWSGVDTAVVTPSSGPGPTLIEVRDARAHQDRLRSIELGLVADATADDSRVVAGQQVGLRLSIWNTGKEPVMVRMSLEGDGNWTPKTPTGDCLGTDQRVEPGTVASCRVQVTVPTDQPITVPYFLALPRDGALYRWIGPAAVRGEPFGPPILRAKFSTTVGGDRAISQSRPVTFRYRDQALGEVRRPLEIVPRVDVKVDPATQVWPTSWTDPQDITVTLTHGSRDATKGSLLVAVPSGWPVVAPVPFELTREDEHQTVVVSVKAPPKLAAGEYQLRVEAVDSGGRSYGMGLMTVDYPHIVPHSFGRRAVVSIRATPLALPRLVKVGYIRGAADRVPEALKSVGVPVVILDRATLERGDLAQFDAIVVGSRAYETDTALVQNNARLLAYTRAGGRVIVQYQQQPYFRGGFTPFPMTLAAPHDRVTDEDAPVKILRADASLFAEPNRITAEDWNGWVQERGLYFAHTWDAAFIPQLETHDPGETPLQGSLLMARVGRGTYIYTGLSFFRQLPAGVTGAYRLFANLLGSRVNAAVP